MSEPRIYGRCISPSKRWDVMHRFGFQCVYCGRTAKEAVLEVDHVIPIAEGGTNDEHNLVPACAQCNMGKGAKRLSQMPSAIKEYALPVEDREWSLCRVYGGMIVGCLFVPPVSEKEMVMARGIAICLGPYLRIHVAMEKANEFRQDDSLDNEARWCSFMSWLEEDGTDAYLTGGTNGQD